MATRRQILKGAAVTSLVTVTGVSIWQMSLSESQELIEGDSYDYQFLTLNDRYVLFAIIPAMLGQALKKLEEKDFALHLMQQIDKAIDFVTQSSQDELRQLFDLLGNQLGRAYFAGVWSSWSSANVIAVTEFLNDWRTSFMSLLRSGYMGLHQIVMGAFYAQPQSWKAIGYPGPPQMNLTDSFYQKFEL
ncbi:hypothetical protein [Kangiella sp. HZ709]|uniref:hypothetical protein n=1 Tax=Kangiella sp. HZ709 TaxID=2666328 RepID=UPI0012B02784|nr:hypothetical protein [Kangiella sp. HZ709]MRX27637.1 hypothetical protein [Kangiella sp. HZ709]